MCPLVKKWQLDEHVETIDDHDDVSIVTPADGEVLTYEAATSLWKNKAAGAGQAYWNLVTETDIITNTSSVSFTGLDLDSARIYLLYMAVTNPQATGGWGYIYFNNDFLATNYYSQILKGNDALVVANRQNRPRVIAFDAGYEAFGWCNIMRTPDGRTRYFILTNTDDPSVLQIMHLTGAWTGTVNVTSIDITAPVANGIGAGSKFILFKAF
jgi:hypothetical protein